MASLPVHMLIRASCEGFVDVWRENTIVRTLKPGDPMDPFNYHNIMIDYTLATLHASILKHKLSIDSNNSE